MQIEEQTIPKQEKKKPWYKTTWLKHKILLTSNTGIHTSSGNQARLLKMKISNVTLKDKIRKAKAQNYNKKSFCKNKIK